MSHSVEERPQDEVDAVIKRLAENDASLSACSLVSKRWHARCRQQSFRRAQLADLDDLRSSDWYPGNPQGTSPITCEELWITPPTVLPHIHYQPFAQIKSLTLDRFSVTPFNPFTIGRTSHYLTSTVETLRLLQPEACPHSLLCFLSEFRNLQDTTIHAPQWRTARQNRSISNIGQFRGTLLLSRLDDESSPFLSLLGSRQTAYETIVLFECGFNSFRPLQDFLLATGETVQRLRIVVPRQGVIPPLSIGGLKVLEDIFISILGVTTSFHHIPPLLASITSPGFQKFILEIRTTAQRESDAIQISLADGISQLDTPLSHLAQNAAVINRRVSLVILGQEPEFLAQGLFDFQELGYIWAGEYVGGDEYSWSVATPRKERVKRCRIGVLDKLFRRKAL